MPKRRCLEPGCPALTAATRCPTHTRAKQQADAAKPHRAAARQAREATRPSRQARGYGKEHEQARAQLLTLLPTYCAYGCGTLLATPRQMVAAHVVDGQPDYGYIPSCITCNNRNRRMHNHATSMQGEGHPHHAT